MTTLPPGEPLSDDPLPSAKADSPAPMKIKGLPMGWRREVVVRKNGQSAGKTDVYYYSPCGKKFRSKPQIARFLGDCADLSAFDFSRAGTPGDGTQRRRARDRSSAKKVDVLRSVPIIRPLTINPLRPSGPIRRTCGVIKLPVKYIRAPSPSEEEGKERANSPTACAKEEQLEPLKPNTITPLPVTTTSSGVAVPALWENRLLGVKACDYETGDDIIPPPKVQNGTVNSEKTADGPVLVPKTQTGSQNRVSTIKSPPPLSSAGGNFTTSLLAQQLQQSLKQAVSLSSGGTSVIPSLLQHTGKVSPKNGQSKENHLGGGKDNIIVSVGTKAPTTGGSIVRVEGKQQVIESLSRMVTDTELRLQEEKVRHLRQQLLAAERN